VVGEGDGLVELMGTGWWGVTLSLSQTYRNKTKKPHTHTPKKKTKEKRRERREGTLSNNFRQLPHDSFPVT